MVTSLLPLLFTEIWEERSPLTSALLCGNKYLKWLMFCSVIILMTRHSNLYYDVYSIFLSIYVREFEMRRLSDWKLVFVLMCFCDSAGHRCRGYPLRTESRWSVTESAFWKCVEWRSCSRVDGMWMRVSSRDCGVTACGSDCKFVFVYHLNIGCSCTISSPGRRIVER